MISTYSSSSYLNQTKRSSISRSPTLLRHYKSKKTSIGNLRDAKKYNTQRNSKLK